MEGNTNKYSLVGLGNKVRFDGWKHGNYVSEIYEKLKKPEENQINERIEKAKIALVKDVYDVPSSFINKKFHGEDRGSGFLSLKEVFKTLNNGNDLLNGNVFTTTLDGYQNIYKRFLNNYHMNEEKFSRESSDTALDLIIPRVGSKVLFVRKEFSVVTTEKCTFNYDSTKLETATVGISKNSFIGKSNEKKATILNGMVKIESDNDFIYKISIDGWDEKTGSFISDEVSQKRLQKMAKGWKSTLIDLKGSDFNGKSFSIYQVFTYDENDDSIIYGFDDISFDHAVKWAIKIEDIMTTSDLKKQLSSYIEKYFLNELSFFTSPNVAMWMESSGVLQSGDGKLLENIYGTKTISKTMGDREKRKKFAERMKRINFILKKRLGVISLLRQADSLLRNVSLDGLRDFLFNVGKYNENKFKTVFENKKSGRHIIKHRVELGEWGVKWDNTLEELDTSLLQIKFSRGDMMIENIIKWCRGIYQRLDKLKGNEFTFNNQNIETIISDVHKNDRKKKLGEVLGSVSYKIEFDRKKNYKENEKLSGVIKNVETLIDIVSVFIQDTIKIAAAQIKLNPDEVIENTDVETLGKIKSMIGQKLSHKEISDYIYNEAVVRQQSNSWSYKVGNIVVNNKTIVGFSALTMKTQNMDALAKRYNLILTTIDEGVALAKKTSEIYVDIYNTLLLPSLLGVNSMEDEINVKMGEYIYKFLLRALESDKISFFEVNSVIMKIAGVKIPEESITNQKFLVIDFWEKYMSGYFTRMISHISSENTFEKLVNLEPDEVRSNVSSFIEYVEKFLVVSESSSLLSNTESLEGRSAKLAKYKEEIAKRVDDALANNKIVDEMGFVGSFNVNLKKKIENAIKFDKQVKIMQSVKKSIVKIKNVATNVIIKKPKSVRDKLAAANQLNKARELLRKEKAKIMEDMDSIDNAQIDIALEKINAEEDKIEQLKNEMGLNLSEEDYLQLNEDINLNVDGGEDNEGGGEDNENYANIDDEYINNPEIERDQNIEENRQLEIDEIFNTALVSLNDEYSTENIDPTQVSNIAVLENEDVPMVDMDVPDFDNDNGFIDQVTSDGNDVTRGVQKLTKYKKKKADELYSQYLPRAWETLAISANLDKGDVSSLYSKPSPTTYKNSLTILNYKNGKKILTPFGKLVLDKDGKIKLPNSIKNKKKSEIMKYLGKFATEKSKIPITMKIKYSNGNGMTGTSNIKY